MTDVMPDLSHLTEEERQIIERVLQRQKVEESQEQELKHGNVQGGVSNVKTTKQKVATQTEGLLPPLDASR
ncbi:hypothetical protein D918_06199 [Trichuris suis]|nr:hypothetical protein D918_06199 [Trichuris suis]